MRSRLPGLRSFIVANLGEAVRDLTALGSPLILLLMVLFVRPDLGPAVLGGLIALEIVGRLVKIAFYTERPRRAAYQSLLEKSDAGSFPSIHAARSAFVFLTLFLVTDGVLFRIVLLGLPVLVGATRLVLWKHRWWDVAAGLAMGAALAFALAAPEAVPPALRWREVHHAAGR